RSLRAQIDGIERLARGHEQPVAFGTAKANIAAHLGQANATDQFAFGCPDRDPAVADRSTCIARTPQVAVDVGANAIRPALDPVDHEVAEKLAVGELVVGTYVEHIHLAFAPGAGIAGTLAGAHHIELLEVGREAQPIGIGYLLLGDHQIEASA